MTKSLAGERIGVLGLARSGRGAARLALARGARVYASDAGSSAEMQEAAEEIRRLGGEADAGIHDLAKLAACDRIVLSPGIPPSAPILSEPEVEGKLIVPELELAAEQIDAPLIVITGTNGKTTTTSLVLHLLTSCGFHAEAGGNIGRALSDVALLDPAPDVVAVEASSFQLGLISALSPDVGVVTNLAPDHLDRYARVEDYYADKARLFANAHAASRWVLNGEDDAVRALPGDAPGERYYFRVGEAPPAGESGGYLDGDGWLVLRVGGAEERIAAAETLPLLGPHNVANALAAAIAVRLVGGDPQRIGEGLRTAAVLEHRLEPVGEVDGVLWINDSKATNLASTRVALRSMRRPTILLLGGRHKGEPYNGLQPEIGSVVRGVIAYGEAADEIEKDLRGLVPVERVDGPFEEVVRRASESARRGDAVLLSPACSSYDMFRDYEERGRRFRDLATGGVE
jgi:UDP-N-acetylmuramoylalanine--D-glutamate ligase